MGKQLRRLLSWVKSEPIIGVCMKPATKVPDASPQMNAVDLLSPFSGWLEEENAEVSSSENHYLKLAPVAITGSALMIMLYAVQIAQCPSLGDCQQWCTAVSVILIVMTQLSVVVAQNWQWNVSFKKAKHKSDWQFLTLLDVTNSDYKSLCQSVILRASAAIQQHRCVLNANVIMLKWLW